VETLSVVHKVAAGQRAAEEEAAESPEEGAWVFGERAKVEGVDDRTEDILVLGIITKF
jgi:hypothetical protein